jgi:hypothetical protein
VEWINEQKAVAAFLFHMASLLHIYSCESVNRSVAYSPDGARIAVGTACGYTLVLDAESHEVLLEKKSSKEAVQVLVLLVM